MSEIKNDRLFIEPLIKQTIILPIHSWESESNNIISNNKTISNITKQLNQNFSYHSSIITSTLPSSSLLISKTQLTTLNINLTVERSLIVKRLKNLNAEILPLAYSNASNIETRTINTPTILTIPTKVSQLYRLPMPTDSLNYSNSIFNFQKSINSNLEDFYSVLSLFFTIVMIIMCLAGVLMNTISLWIFTRRAFRKRSINILLAGLSASDVCLCFLAIPTFSLNQLEKVIPDIYAGILSRILIYGYPIALMAQTSSVWMLVIITIDRYLAVCHPFTVRIYCTTSRAIIIIVCCVIFSICYNFVRFWEYTIDEDGDSVIGLLRENSYYMVLYQNIAMLLTQFILPLLVLGVLNLQVAKAILEASENRRVLVTSEKSEHRTAKMMLFVVIVFLFCYILSFCLNLLEIFNPVLFKNQIGFLLNDVNNVLVVINSSSSFIFYTKYSSRYCSQLQIVQHDICRYCCYLFINKAKQTHGNNHKERKNNPPRKFSSSKTYSGVSPTTINVNCIRQQKYNDNFLLTSNPSNIQKISTLFPFFFSKKTLRDHCFYTSLLRNRGDSVTNIKVSPKIINNNGIYAESALRS